MPNPLSTRILPSISIAPIYEVSPLLFMVIAIVSTGEALPSGTHPYKEAL